MNNPPEAPAAAAPAVVPEEDRIESLDQWLERRGLRNAAAEEEDRWERQQDRQRVAEETAYASAIHREAFESEDARRATALRLRAEQLQMYCAGRQMTICCDNGAALSNVDVLSLADTCEFVFCWATTWHRFNNPTDEEEEVKNHLPLELNLPEYSKDTVQTFLDIVAMKTKTLEDVTDGQTIVDLCQLAHYLQHSDLLEDTTAALVHSIDTANCLALTELAHALDLPRLFEAALGHMMQSVQHVGAECWDDLTPQLQQRIAAIQTAIKSSIHNNNRGTGALYFGSLDEYLAIFAERVFYYKERLYQATEQQELDARPQSAAWRYAQDKIERQRQRLHTLEVAFREQKKLFGNDRTVLLGRSTTESGDSS